MVPNKNPYRVLWPYYTSFTGFLFVFGCYETGHAHTCTHAHSHMYRKRSKWIRAPSCRARPSLETRSTRHTTSQLADPGCPAQTPKGGGPVHSSVAIRSRGFGRLPFSPLFTVSIVMTKNKRENAAADRSIDRCCSTWLDQ